MSAMAVRHLLFFAAATIALLGLFACGAASHSPTPVPSASASAFAQSQGRSATSAPPAALPAASRTPTPTPAPPTATAASTAGLPVGPGPQRAYAVQPQPPSASCHYRLVDAAAGEVLPDPNCTPGAISPAVTQQNLASTICRSGYTRSVRPPTSVTQPEKYANAASYGYAGSMSLAEYDHLIPLELGGDPNDPRNLWVEPNAAGAKSFNNPKDSVESSLNYLVCNAVHGKPYLPLAKAQELIAVNWTTARTDAQAFLVNP